MSYSKYLKDGYDDICDYPTYKYYRKLRMKQKVKRIIKMILKGE